MSSILDHVEQSVPRATVYGAMKGSPVFIGKYFREVNPSSNATDYQYSKGERKITFILASPDKTIFHDMRSVYLKFKVGLIEASIGGGTTVGKISEPASNIIERIVIKMNGTVVEDISRLDFLTTFFKNTLLTREQKNARRREGYDYVPKTTLGIRTYASGVAKSTAVANNKGGVAAAFPYAAEPGGTEKDEPCVKLDISGIMNVQQLLSGYYSPLEIELYLQDPGVCCEGLNSIVKDLTISNPRLCIDQIVMSPEYVSAFESALLANSNAQGIQIPFSTYYTYNTDVQSQDATFWIRKPVRYLRSIYFGATQREPAKSTNYYFYRVKPTPEVLSKAGTSNDADAIERWQISIGTKSYRQIEEKLTATLNQTEETNDNKQTYNESAIMFAKAVGHYNDYSTETDELRPKLKALQATVQGLDLEFSPDNDVLASETTLNSNDVRLRIQKTSGHSDATARIYVFLNYQASIALFPGNETRLLVT